MRRSLFLPWPRLPDPPAPGFSPAGQLAQNPRHRGWRVDPGEERVTICHKLDRRKLSGNSAPFRRNLVEYLAAHPDWEVYQAQPSERPRRSPQSRWINPDERPWAKPHLQGPPHDVDRVTVWHKEEHRKLSGNSAPLRRNLKEYLKANPEWEVPTPSP